MRKSGENADSVVFDVLGLKMERSAAIMRAFLFSSRVDSNDTRLFSLLFWCAMLKDRTRIERQLSLSQQQLSAWETQLEQQGVTGKAKNKNATWRHLNADHRQLKRRLIAVAALEAREAAVVQRRAEKETAAQSEQG